MPRGPTCCVFRRKRTINGRPRLARTYTARVGLPGQPPRTVPTGCVDKRVASDRARELLRELEQERGGLILPRSVRDGVQRPLIEHLPDFVADLRVRGRNVDHIYTVEKRLQRLLTACGWKWLRDVSLGSFDSWRRTQTDAAGKTLNDYLAVAKQFFAWLKRQGRSAGNPLEFGEKSTLAGRTQARAAFSLDEQERLLAVSGERAAVYLLALRTALRRGEIDQLRWVDVHLASTPPVVRVRASVSKNRRQTDMPLCDDIAGVLRQMLGSCGKPGDLVFPRGCPDMDLFRADLAAAGISGVDVLERRRDFHALRVTAITNAKVAGVSPALAQMFARHSDSRLTESVYTDASQLPTADVVRLLPQYALVEDIGRKAAEFHAGAWTREWTTERAVSGRFVSRADEPKCKQNRSQVTAGKRVGREQSRCDATGRGPTGSSPTRTRT